MPKRVKHEVLGKDRSDSFRCQGGRPLRAYVPGMYPRPHCQENRLETPTQIAFFCFVANKWLTRSANGTVRRASFDFPSRTCIHPYRALPAGLDARHSIATPGPRPSAKRNPAIPRPRHGVTEGKLLDKPAQSCGRGRNRETSLLAADEPLACP
jgi:hypothetical protein